MRPTRSWMTWAVAIAGAVWLARHYLRSREAGTLPADFDDDQFLEDARALARRERRWGALVLQRSQDESLRALARMVLAQHQAADGIWVRFDTEAAGDDETDSTLSTLDGAEFDREAGFTLQSILDQAWPLFHQASQRSADPQLRDWAVRTMTWLEEAEQTLASIAEQFPPASPGFTAEPSL